MQSREVKHFSFAIFHNQSKSCEKGRNYIIATIKVHIRNRNRFVLSNEETIIHEWKNWNRNF